MSRKNRSPMRSSIAGLEFLWNGAVKYSTASPALSRHLMMLFKRRMPHIEGAASCNEADRHVCNFCGNFWILGNCTRKLVSRRRIPKSITTIRKLRIKNRKKLTKNEARILKMDDKLSVTRVYKCGVCSKVSKIALGIPERKRLPEIALTDDGKMKLDNNRSNKIVKRANCWPTTKIHGRYDGQMKSVSRVIHMKKCVNQMTSQRGRRKKNVSESRERLLEQIREAKTDRTESEKGNSFGGNNKMVSVMMNLLKSHDTRKDKFKSGRQLLSFLSNL